MLTLSRAMMLLPLLAVAAACAGLWHVLDRPVQRLVIGGELSAAEQDVIRGHIDRAALRGVLSTDLDALLGRLAELGWVREASVRREWPQTLHLTLVREAPVAAWGEGVYVSGSGQLLPLPDVHVDVPSFNVAASTPQQAMRVYRLLEHLVARRGLSLAALNQDAQGEWHAVTTEGLTIYLGAQQISDRMTRFLEIYDGALQHAQRPVVYADMRYASGAAVRFKDEPRSEVADSPAPAGTVMMAGNN